MVKVCVKIFFRIYVFQDWTPFCGQLRDSGSRETFSSTTLVLIFSSTALVLIFWLLWVHKDSLNPIYFCLGEVGHPVAQYCSISPLKQDAKSAPEVGDGLPLQLPGVPGQRTPKLVYLPLRTWMPAAQGFRHPRGGKKSPAATPVIFGYSKVMHIPDICNFFYTGSIFEFQILHLKID